MSLTPVDPKFFSTEYDKRVRWVEPCDVDGYECDVRPGEVSRVLGPDAEPHNNWVDKVVADSENIDGVIDAQLEYFKKIKRGFGWNLHSYDSPENIEERITAKGFTSDDPWATFLARHSDDYALGSNSYNELESRLIRLKEKDGIEIQKITDPDDITRMEAAQKKVWGDRFSWIAGDLQRQLKKSPEKISIYFAFDSKGIVRSYGWTRFLGESGFAMFSGGTTDPDFRGKGIYRSLVDLRLCECHKKEGSIGVVVALETSRPILESMGFNAVAKQRFFLYRG